MPDGSERRSDDLWRGEINARVAALERRIDSQDTRAGVLGQAISTIQVDMSAIRTEVRQITSVLQESARDAKQDRDELIMDLKDTLKQRKLSTFQIVLAVGAPVLAALLIWAILTAITGSHSVVGVH